MAAIPTFAEAAKRGLEQQRAGWRSSEHARSCLRGLELYAFPRIGKMPVSEVTSADVLEILYAHLAHQESDGKDRSSAHRCGAGMGHCHGLENGQPVRPDSVGARASARCRPTPSGVAPPRGGGGHRHVGV